MKKRLIALFLAVVMCMTLSSPAMGIVLNESEIMPREDDYRCHHTPPSGYTYLEYREGNSVCDFWIENGVGWIAAKISGLGTVVNVISGYTTFEYLWDSWQWVREGNQLKTEYHRYTYVNEEGNYWHHYYWYSIGDDGYMHYLACDVVQGSTH